MKQINAFDSVICSDATVLVYITVFFRDSIISINLQINHSTDTILVLITLYFIILFRCHFYAFICLYCTYINDKKI